MKYFKALVNIIEHIKYYKFIYQLYLFSFHIFLTHELKFQNTTSVKSLRNFNITFVKYF